MSRLLIRRFLLIPMVLLLVTVLGYAHAHLLLPIRAARIPHLSLFPDPGPLLPSYLDCSQTAIHLECGILPYQEETITQIIVDASQAGAGLLALALTLSAIIGLGLGVETVRIGEALVPGKHHVTVSRLDRGEGTLVALAEGRP